MKTYPPADAIFHESFDNLEAAHSSLTFPYVVITTTIVDTDYSHGPYQRQRPAAQRHGDWPATSKCPLPAEQSLGDPGSVQQATWRRHCACRSRLQLR